uniref:Serine carboxypeptidase n=2 Tax=Ixodes ricinus TaxID=34613 RepID=V5H0G7_IXORI
MFQRSALYSVLPPVVEAYITYTNTSDFKQSLHVLSDFEIDSLRPIVAFMLSRDFFTDISAKLMSALDYQNFLLYTGQVDALFPSTNFSQNTSQLSKMDQEGSILKGLDGILGAHVETFVGCRVI